MKRGAYRTKCVCLCLAAVTVSPDQLSSLAPPWGPTDQGLHLLVGAAPTPLCLPGTTCGFLVFPGTLEAHCGQQSSASSQPVNSHSRSIACYHMFEIQIYPSFVGFSFCYSGQQAMCTGLSRQGASLHLPHRRTST